MKRSIVLLPLLFVGFFLSTVMWISIAFAAPALPDPLTDPAGAVDDLSQLQRQGWPVFAFGLATVLSLALGKLGVRYPKVKALAWFGKRDIAIALGLISATGLACYNAAADNGSWSAILTAAIVALATRLQLPGDPENTEELAEGEA